MNDNTIKEVFINDFINPISIKGMEKITFQLKNCVCKIRKKGNVKDTGFFCKIPFPNYNKLLTVLFTNNHVLDQNDLMVNNKIDITINDDNEIRSILIDNSRIFFTDYDLDVTIIEIKPNIDKINNFLELEEKIFKEKNLVETIFKKKSAYVLNYPKGENIGVSFGKIVQLNDQKIKHSCSTDNGSPGSPILDLDSFKVIGIHYGSSNNNFQFNKGTFMKNIVSKFINSIQKGINNLNTNYNMNNVNNDINNMNNMLSIVNLNNNNIVGQNMMINNNQNIINNNNNFNGMNNNIKRIKMYNVKFKVSQGIIYNTKVRYYETMHSLLNSFLDKILTTIKHNYIGIQIQTQFYYNGLNINYNNYGTKVEFYFGNDLNPIIFINDIYNNIRTLKFIFNDNHGNQVNIFVNDDNREIYILLSDYLREIDQPIDAKEIQFLYKNKIIEYVYDISHLFKIISGDTSNYVKNTTIDEYFKIDHTKINNEFHIFANDINNLIKVTKITFKYNQTDKLETFINKKKTIKELIIKYFEKMNHKEIIELQRENEIEFKYNQKYIKYYDNTTIEEYFKNDSNPIIQVNDDDEMLLEEPFTNYYIIFETSQGYTSFYVSEIKITMKDIISNYFRYIDQPELIDNRDKIIFLYNGKKINENLTARKCFKIQTKPKLFVMDENNLLINGLKFNGKRLEKISVIFKTNHDTIIMTFNYSVTAGEMIKEYLLKIKHPEYINNNKIQFIYNSKTLNYEEYKEIGELLQHHSIITVMGIY